MDPYKEALQRFSRLHERAARLKAKGRLHEPGAMTLATSDPSGRVSSRTVLLKGFGPEGFVFFTNLESRKGRQLQANPRASLCFYWDPLGEQVTVEGTVERITEEETDAYWRSRPRLSQIGAWASRQSRPLLSRAALLADVLAVTRRFAGKPVPRPPRWSGLRIVPERIEFFKASLWRLNERTVFKKESGRWTRGLLYP